MSPVAMHKEGYPNFLADFWVVKAQGRRLGGTVPIAGTGGTIFKYGWMLLERKVNSLEHDTMDSCPS